MTLRVSCLGFLRAWGLRLVSFTVLGDVQEWVEGAEWEGPAQRPLSWWCLDG